MPTHEIDSGRRRYTIEEYRSLPDEDGFLSELAQGALVREPRPGPRHGATVMLLGKRLVDWALENGGTVTTESGFVLAEDPPTVRGPDLAYLRRVEEPYGTEDAFVRGPPDLAVEVVSPSNSAAGIQRKVIEYFQAGSSQVWIVHPETRTVVVHRSETEARVLREGDHLEGGDLLPGLDVPLSKIFP